VQLERIAPGHEHIDLVYFARPLADAIAPSDECERPGWYGLPELERLGVNDEIGEWCARAIERVGACAKIRG
jgi:hypothetical protein